MAPPQPLQGQQSNARSTRYSTSAATNALSRRIGAGCATIKFRTGNRLSLPPWMSFHHLPEYGIVLSSSGAACAPSTSLLPSTEAVAWEEHKSLPTTRLSSTMEKRRSHHCDGNNCLTSAASVLLKSVTSNGAGQIENIGVINSSTYAAPQVSASNYKTKKEVAMDSLYPPTTQEIYGHIRYLSEEGMKLVMKEVDECVRYSLRYSATESKLKGERRKKLEIADGLKMTEPEDWEPGLVTLASGIQNHLDMFQPDYQRKDSVEDTTSVMLSKANECTMELKGVESETSSQREDILGGMISKRYDPTLLPMVIIKCHPNMLDRAKMAEGLFFDLSNKSNCKRNHTHLQGAGETEQSPCVCIINSNYDLVRQGLMMTEVLSQCISNDPNGESFTFELKRQRKRRKSHRHGGANGCVLVRSVWSWTRSLAEWADFTDAFGSIVVILEDPEKIPSPTLDSFFITLASLRSNHGVPIGVVVMDATPGGLGNRFSKLRDPSLRGMAGVVASELIMPLPQVQLEIFGNRLFSGKCVPTLLWTNHRLLKHIQELFQECDNSIVSAGKKMKSELRRYFSVPVAFISLFNCEKYFLPNESRLKWLFGDEYCRRIVLSHPASATLATKEGREDCHIFGLFWKVKTSHLCHQLRQRINAIFDICPLGKIGQAGGSEFHSSVRMRQLLLLLRNLRDKVRTWKHISVTLSNCSTLLCKRLNEYIIFAGKFATGLESHECTARALIEDLVAWTTVQFSVQTALEDASTVQPRREVAKGLSLHTPDALVHCDLAHVRQIAFLVFRSRVMLLADWHKKFFEYVVENDGQNLITNEAAFFFAIYELVHCGFVRKLVPGRRKAYEKVAIIWGSGR